MNENPPIIHAEGCSTNLGIIGAECNCGAVAQRDADAKFYEGVIQQLTTQTRKLLKPAEKARRDTVYAVEVLLEEEGIGLYRTAMRGDECLAGERVSVNIIRRVLEDYAQS